MSALAPLKAEWEAFGAQHHARTSRVSDRMLKITGDTGVLPGLPVHATAALRVLEIGTSNGYSTVWPAEAEAALHGAVTTLQGDAGNTALAQANFERAGLAANIHLQLGDAGAFLQRCAPQAHDLVFLDSERTHSPHGWPALRATLRPGGLLVVDNAASHAAEMALFTQRVRADPGFASCCLVPIGKGEFMALKHSA